MTICSLDVLLFNLEPVCCSMFSSNCCFLTCIQTSQEVSKVVWYFHLLKNFSVCLIYTVKSFSIINEAEVDVLLEFSCFSYDPTDVRNLISGSSAFFKFSLYIWKFSIHMLLKPRILKMASLTLLAVVADRRMGNLSSLSHDRLCSRISLHQSRLDFFTQQVANKRATLEINQYTNNQLYFFVLAITIWNWI